MCCKKNHKFTEHEYFTEWLLLALGWHQKSQIKLEDSSSLSACHMDYATSIEKQGYQLQGMLLTSSVVGQSEASTRMRFFVRQPSPSGMSFASRFRSVKPFWHLIIHFARTAVKRLTIFLFLSLYSKAFLKTQTCQSRPQYIGFNLPTSSCLMVDRDIRSLRY